MKLDQARRIQTKIMTDLLGFRPVPYKGRWRAAPKHVFAPPDGWKRERAIKRPFAALPDSMAIGTAIGLPPTPNPNGYRVTLLCQRLRDMNGRVAERARQMVKAVGEKEELEVVYTGRVVGLGSKKKAVPKKKKQTTPPAIQFRIGDVVSVAPHESGTLGCRVTLPGDTAEYFLSNYHVLAGSPETYVGLADSFGVQPDIAAKICAVHIPQPGDGNIVDCAIAEVQSGYKLDCGYIKGAPAVPAKRKIIGLYDDEVSNGMLVLKVGAASQGQKGFLSHRETALPVGLDLDGDNESESYEFSGQYMISPKVANKPFGIPGDSGSVVFTQTMKGVGLLFASGVEEDRNAENFVQYAYANPLPEALAKFNAEIWTDD